MLLDYLLIITIFAWLGAVTVFVFRFWSFFKGLTKGATEKDLKSLLEEVAREISLAKEEKKKLAARLEELEKEGNSHFKKIGLVRYNPFSDTGGDQSFALAIMDNHDDGIVITSLHNRNQTRVFAKPVTAGKESGYEFSKEEIEAVLKAKKEKKGK